ncbi:MAG: tRNA dihydrouridine synthase DusB [Desulfobacterales bacterium]|nr:tRNA dihydrouridine synthase DusB [Desulfobacterales bacterium]
MQIGSLKLENQTVLAPLAGITNLPFRLLAKEAGCALVCSEMVSAHGLVNESYRTQQLLDSQPQEKPLSVQIFGSQPDVMAEAARLVEASGADILDINFGCAVRKIIKTGSGVALMRTPDTAAAVMREVRKAVSIPLTVKLRSGWDPTGNQAFEIAKIAESCGVDAIAIHPRTANQGFSGRADWTVIKELKKRVAVPVIGNGDICSADDAIAMLAQTGCDAIMIGRMAIGNPWIFSHVRARLLGEAEPQVGLEQQFELMRRYLQASVKYFGEEIACRMMRSRLCWFAKGLRNSSQFRKSINHISTQAEALQRIEAYQVSLQMGQ